MPHTRSARKNRRKSEKRRLYNKAVLRDVKIQVKKFADTAENGSVDQLKAEYNEAARELDKAAARHVIHRNLAARKKSQLARKVNAKLKPKTAPAK
jgi:small subunit ribosomal protein S20